MTIATFMFYFFEVMAALSALALIFVRNVFYGALLLLICLLSLAGIYVLAFAEFVAVTQILIYAGGILVVIIFGIMLTTKISGKPLVVKHGNWLAGIFAGISMAALLMTFFSQESFSVSPIPPVSKYGAIEQIGIQLMTGFALPFEVAGVLLLITLAGAAVIASTIKSKKI
ncbi:MAG: NADH-quinone oxidoreductase subunit J [Cyclobacteriaceae bacterium]|nr:NADH-quinone oxidoreductase subunit J [Cyclobacteriaceae bacterium]